MTDTNSTQISAEGAYLIIAKNTHKLLLLEFNTEYPNSENMLTECKNKEDKLVVFSQFSKFWYDKMPKIAEGIDIAPTEQALYQICKQYIDQIMIMAANEDIDTSDIAAYIMASNEINELEVIDVSSDDNSDDDIKENNKKINVTKKLTVAARRRMRAKRSKARLAENASN
jgi:hypothetical protein